MLILQGSDRQNGQKISGQETASCMPSVSIEIIYLNLKNINQYISAIIFLIQTYM